MRILVLGSTGMLGHQLVKSLSVNHEVKTLARGIVNALDPVTIGTLEAWLYTFKSDAVINCIGIVKQRESSPEEMIEVNSVFPHKLAALTRKQGTRLIHFSTDCVFSGRSFGDGDYKEGDALAATDLYGRSKALGELEAPGCVTLRTSIVGRELKTKQGIVEWFLSMAGHENSSSFVSGYTRAHFSGVTTIEAARIVEAVLAKPDVSGVYHAGGPKISKYDLLTLLKECYGMGATHVYQDISVAYDRSLNSDRFYKTFRYAPASWRRMILELAKECPL